MNGETVPIIVVYTSSEHFYHGPFEDEEHARAWGNIHLRDLDDAVVWCVELMELP